MNQKKYCESIDQLRISEDFNMKTAKLMKETQNNTKGNKFPLRKLVFTCAGAALLVFGGVFAFHYNNFLPVKQSAGVNDSNAYTVDEIKLPGASSTPVNADMLPLFVYQGRIYIHYNTSFETGDGDTVSEEDMTNLRGDYLGKTIGGINEWSKQEEYQQELVSNIGEGDVYTVKGYDSKYRLMVYTRYEDGFGCEIYDSFGGLQIKEGEDFFGIIKLKENAASYQWESFDSWNNGKSERNDATVDTLFQDFMKKLYEAAPLEGSTDMLIENISSDSQKFVYVKTKDHLITTLRLLKDGYVYMHGVGFFQVEKDAFDAFYNAMPVM